MDQEPVVPNCAIRSNRILRRRLSAIPSLPEQAVQRHPRLSAAGVDGYHKMVVAKFFRLIQTNDYTSLISSVKMKWD